MLTAHLCKQVKLDHVIYSIHSIRYMHLSYRLIVANVTWRRCVSTLQFIMLVYAKEQISEHKIIPLQIVHITYWVLID